MKKVVQFLVLALSAVLLFVACGGSTTIEREPSYDDGYVLEQPAVATAAPAADEAAVDVPAAETVSNGKPQFLNSYATW